MHHFGINNYSKSETKNLIDIEVELYLFSVILQKLIRLYILSLVLLLLSISFN